MQLAILASLRAVIVFTILLGLAYPLAILGIGQTVFAENANGSLLIRNYKLIGSKWIGQAFTGDAFFHARPSATGPKPYSAEASSGSNYGPLHPDRLKSEAAAPAGMPRDLFQASGSGLDPHISPEAARYQAPRVAKARNLSLDTVLQRVNATTEPCQFGFLGEPRVNVLLLNLSLDSK
jgi:K+-transporting ATPase ATPase C chain